jgi:oligoendopeptidase F
MAWTWANIEPRYDDLEARPLDGATVDSFLREWSELAARVQEMGTRLRIATSADTADEEAARQLYRYLDEIAPGAQRREQALKQKLLASGLEPENFGVPLRKMRAEAALFREENIPLLTEDAKLSEEYFKITGARRVEWEGKEVPLQQLRPVLQDQDRDRRERAWRLMTQRQLADREALNDLWGKLLAVRRRIAANAGFPEYRAYAWEALHRFDYTPEDARRFHAAVEAEASPALRRRHERRKERLGVDRLRPWDLEVDPLAGPVLEPFGDASRLEAGIAAIFGRVDPTLGERFQTLVREGFTDLPSRKSKAPGAFCAPLSATRRPFIFGSVVGTQDDVEMMLHEGGHAMHVFEAGHLPYLWQRDLNQLGAEFSEVGSMAMEFLAAAYLTRDEGGFYDPRDAARARIEHLEQRVLALWPRLMIYDAFQHWVYEHPDEAANPSACDTVCAELTRRFIPVVDYEGLEDELATGWHNVLHIHVAPFYMIEYALAELGAVQIWGNALRDQKEAVARYRRALALGDTRPIPELYAAAGVRFAFDRETLHDAIALVERTLEELDTQAP